MKSIFRLGPDNSNVTSVMFAYRKGDNGHPLKHLWHFHYQFACNKCQDDALRIILFAVILPVDLGTVFPDIKLVIIPLHQIHRNGKSGVGFPERLTEFSSFAFRKPKILCRQRPVVSFKLSLKTQKQFDSNFDSPTNATRVPLPLPNWNCWKHSRKCCWSVRLIESTFPSLFHATLIQQASTCWALWRWQPTVLRLGTTSQYVEAKSSQSPPNFPHEACTQTNFQACQRGQFLPCCYEEAKRHKAILTGK